MSVASFELDAEAFKPKTPVGRFLVALEEGLGTILIIILTLVAGIPFFARVLFGAELVFGDILAKELVKPIVMIRIAITTRYSKHLGISLGVTERKDWLGTLGRSLSSFNHGIVLGVFAITSITFLQGFYFEFSDPSNTILFIPFWVFMVFFPIGMLTVAWRTFPRRWSLVPKLLYLLGVAASIALCSLTIAGFSQVFFGVDASWTFDAQQPFATFMSVLSVPLILMLIAGAFLGTNLFVVLGGIGLFLFAGSDITIDSVLMSTTQLLKGSTVPAIVLFTVTGFFLSESKAGERYVLLFKALLGRLPGGIIIVAVTVSAFFTAFTGASGITILALGALLYSILNQSAKNSEGLSVGLITGAGAIGLLFPPSLAVMILGSMLMTSIADLYFAGILPGLLFIIAMVIVGMLLSRRERGKQPRELPPKVSAKEKLLALKAAGLELLTPIIVIVAVFSGESSFIGAAALAVIYSAIVAIFVKKELDFKGLMRVCLKSLSVVGGILAILCFARGLSDYFTLMGIPQALTAWAQAVIQSPILFLLLLNILLFIVGCFMDIFSAMTVLVPLLLPVATAFGIHPLHFGMIFLSNLSVGFITPPVGMDLFLAAYRFNRPMTKIYRDVIPFVLVQVVVVLLVTYIPWLSQGIPALVAGASAP